MMRVAGLWLGLLVQLVTLPVLAQEAHSPVASVEQFTPQGAARQVRQVTARFTVPIVTLGDPRLPDPFDVQCPAPGQGRWADPRNWVYDFDEDLPAGLRCTFTLRAAAANGRRGCAVWRSHLLFQYWRTRDRGFLSARRVGSDRRAAGVPAAARRSGHD